MLVPWEGVILKNHAVKNSANVKQGTTLFSQERVRVEITQSKVALTILFYNTIFRRKSKTKNEPVKISDNGTKGTIMLFSQDRV